MAYQLIRRDSGIDGHDATSEPAEVFTTRQRAVDWLKARGYTYQDPRDVRARIDHFEHQDVTRRHTMNQITYDIRSIGEVDPPVDPQHMTYLTDAEVLERVVIVVKEVQLADRALQSRMLDVLDRAIRLV